MMDSWGQDILEFLKSCNKHKVEMIMVGGGAVNFHGYQRHSADIDFWFDPSPNNLERLKAALTEIGITIESFPDSVKNKEQNISIKFSPDELSIELITQFSIGKSFQEALTESELTSLIEYPEIKYRVLRFDDLIDSKIRSGRPKDLLDVQELKRLNSKD